MKRLALIPLVLLTACATPPPGGDPLIGTDDHPVVIIHDPRRNVDENEAIVAYEAFLAHAPADEPRRPAVERRIAGLHLLAAEAASLEPGQAARARRHFLAAVALYERLLPTTPRDEQAALLYGLAEAYEGLGRPTDERRVLERLVREHPQSELRAEAGFRLAEAAFRRGELALAARGYETTLVMDGASPFRLQARYKLAWTRLRQQHYAAAARVFLDLLDALATRQHSRPLPATASPMNEDALRGLALSLRHIGGVEGLERLLDDHPGPGQARLYEALGEQQLAHGDPDAALTTWRRYAVAHPEKIAAARLWLRIIRLESSLGRKTEAARSKRRFAEAFAAGAPLWRQHEPRALPEVARPLARLYRELGSQAHARAQESGADTDYREAAHWYRNYLELFGDEQAAAEIRYLLAELYEASGQMQAAIAAYERFAYRYPGDQRAAEAAYAALQLTEPAETVSQAFLQRLTRFVNTFPRHPRLTLVLARTASRLYEAGQVTPALELAGRILDRHPAAPPEARRVALLIRARKAYEDDRLAAAERDYEALLALTPNADAEHDGLVADLARIVYRRGRRALDAGHPLVAAKALARVRDVAPGSPIEATAEFDAATAYIQAAHWPEAVVILERFRDNYPDSPLAKRIPAKLAMALPEAGRPVRAAAVLSKIAEGHDADEATRREALLRAADLYRENGDEARATTLYRRYVVRYPAPFETAQTIRRRLADLSRKAGRPAEYRHWLKALVEAAKDRPLPRPLAATAAIELADIEMAGYRSLRLTLPLKPSLARKQARFESVLATYRRAAGFGVAEVTTAATFRLGEAYADFAQALMRSERPAGLAGDELEDYDVLLEERAEPFEARSIELHEGNLRRLAEGHYDRWVAASIDRLAALFPARYARPELGEAYLDRTDGNADE